MIEPESQSNAGMPDKDEKDELSEPSSPTASQPETQESTGVSIMNDLLVESRELESLVPDDYQTWQRQANLLLNALGQLETRHIQPDPHTKVLGVPLRDRDLRDAAEKALRNCAHFATSATDRIALIDEANRIRRTSWF